MNTQHLKYVIEVERTGSISQAAENLYIGQPTLSKAIKELEDELNITIFRRSPKGTVPTEEGDRFLQCARNMLSQLSEMEGISRRTGEKSGRLRICLPHAAYMLDTVYDYITRTEFSGETDVRIAECDTQTALTKLIGGSYGFAVVRFDAVRAGYVSDFASVNGLKYELLWDFEPVVLRAKQPSVTSEIREDALKDMNRLSSELDKLPFIGKIREDGRNPLRMGNVAGCLSVLGRLKNAYMLESPLNREILEKYSLMQQRIVSCPVRWRDVIVFASGNTLSGEEIRCLDELYAAKNRIAFANFR